MKRTIGTLTLISYTQGFDWEVYDEDGRNTKGCFVETSITHQKKTYGWGYKMWDPI